MLSTVTAAELQFRVDTAERDRERSILAAIRDRRSAAASLRVTASARVPDPRRPAAWPRPIAAQPASC